MANQTPIFAEAEKAYVEARHKVQVELTQARLTDLMEQKNFVTKEMKALDKELEDINKEVAKLRTEGVEE